MGSEMCIRDRHFGEHAYDDQGNYIGSDYSEGQEAWEEYFAEHGGEAPVPNAGEGEAAAAPAEAAEAVETAEPVEAAEPAEVAPAEAEEAGE